MLQLHDAIAPDAGRVWFRPRLILINVAVL